MIIVKSMSPGWLSNTWLVGDQPGGKAVLIDTGGPTKPILKALEEYQLELTHVLCTHHHIDHVQHNDFYRDRYHCPVCGHARERSLFQDLDQELEDGECLRTGGLEIRALHIPGHTLGQLGFLINDQRVFTGDTLFRGSVGGTRGPGHTNFDDLQRSIMEVLMQLSPETQVHPGHTETTTIRDEWETNPFIRLWRGLDSTRDQACQAFGQPARLLLRARDYDGGTKCWVRFTETGTLDVVPGSAVQAV